MKRENFGSRLGFLLVSAGCAIGIGNVWRFPYVAGQNGGGVFVLFYLLFLLCMGVPVLTMELAVGRAGRKSAVGAYRALEKPGSKWHVHGWFCILGCYLLMMYYTTVSGWMLSYFVKFATGTFTGMNADQVAGVFGDMLSNPGEMGFWMAVTVVVGFFICSRGLQNGLEKITKWMMAALLLLILVLAGHSLILPGAKEGLSFYLLPDFKRASDVGLGSVIMAAMNQSYVDDLKKAGTFDEDKQAEALSRAISAALKSMSQDAIEYIKEISGGDTVGYLTNRIQAQIAQNKAAKAQQ